MKTILRTRPAFLVLALSAAFLTFVACGNSGEQIGKKINNFENKVYERALLTIVNKLNEAFPRTVNNELKVDKITLDDKYLNLNIVVNNKIIPISESAKYVNENRDLFVNLINDLLQDNDDKNFIQKIGIDGDFTSLKGLLSHILRKTNREIAICLRGGDSGESVIATTISPDELK